MLNEAFGNEAIKQLFINLLNAAVSCFAHLDTVKGGNFASSAFDAIKLKHKFFDMQLFSN